MSAEEPPTMVEPLQKTIAPNHPVTAATATNSTTNAIASVVVTTASTTATATNPSDGGPTVAAQPATIATPLPAETGTDRLGGDSLEQHCRNVEDELQRLRDSEQRLKQQHIDSKRREHILTRRLALKEQELLDYANQITEFKSAQVPAAAALRNALLDPAVNLLLQKLRTELQTTRARLEDTQNELSAWKFTPDSNTGKRLMAKCRLLYQENEELGRMTSNGRMAKLEGDLALQKSFSEEVKKSQSELDDFLQELDEDVEGMQSTILFLQQELKTAKDTIGTLENELVQLRNSSSSNTSEVVVAKNSVDATDIKPLTNGQVTNSSLDGNAASGAESDTLANVDAVRNNGDAAGAALTTSALDGGEQQQQHTIEGTTTTTAQQTADTLTNPDDSQPPPKVNGCGAATVQLNGKRSFDESNSVDDDAVPVTGGGSAATASLLTVVSAKKIRRSSVLSLDLNEEDSRIDCDDERTVVVQSCNGVANAEAAPAASSASAANAVAVTVSANKVAGGGI